MIYIEDYASAYECEVEMDAKNHPPDLEINMLVAVYAGNLYDEYFIGYGIIRELGWSKSFMTHIASVEMDDGCLWTGNAQKLERVSFQPSQMKACLRTV